MTRLHDVNLQQKIAGYIAASPVNKLYTSLNRICSGLNSLIEIIFSSTPYALSMKYVTSLVYIVVCVSHFHLMDIMQSLVSAICVNCQVVCQCPCVLFGSSMFCCLLIETHYFFAFNNGKPIYNKPKLHTRSIVSRVYINLNNSLEKHSLLRVT
jgi:uncharacterized membrane protein YesL